MNHGYWGLMFDLSEGGGCWLMSYVLCLHERAANSCQDHHASLPKSVLVIASLQAGCAIQHVPAILTKQLCHRCQSGLYLKEVEQWRAFSICCVHDEELKDWT